MKRSTFTCAALLCCLSLATAAFAQATKTPVKKDVTPAAAPAAPPPPSPELAKARMRPPVKGTAYIDIIKGTSKRVGSEIVTVTKVMNTSNSPIAGLRLDEWWYAGQQQVSGGTARMRQPLAPGETTELTTSSPWKPGMTSSSLQFTHANGQVKLTAVKKFGENDKKK